LTTGKIVALYALDQDRDTTSSLGIMQYTRRLIEAFTRQPDPGFCVELWLSAANRSDLVPQCELPDWLRCHVLGGRFARGWHRLYADHLLAPRLAQRRRASIVHFPKGWIPLFMPPATGTVATLHDVIVQHYRKHHAAAVSRLKLAYFDWNTRHTLRRADRVMTDSRYSASELMRLVPRPTPPRVVYLGPGLPVTKEAAGTKRQGILVLGSAQPHKATRLTLERLAGYARASGETLDVTVTGLASPPDSWDLAPSVVESLSLTWTGRLSDHDLSACMWRHRALVLLSEIEGFGMPAVEAYAHNLPVCYRNSTSLAELMQGLPGGCSADNQAAFDAAMNSVLTMAPEEIRTHRDRILDMCNWDTTARAVLSVYREQLSRSPQNTGGQYDARQ